MNKTTKFKQTEIGLIPEDWDVVIASESITIISGGTPDTYVSKYWNGNIPWISIYDIVNSNRWIHDTQKKISESGLNESSTNLLKPSQVIISARGTIGLVAQLRREMAFNQSCYGLDGNKNFDNDFLYYAVKYMANEFISKTHGSVFNTITKDTFRQIYLSRPPLHEQRSIAKILSDLDSKIELLQEQNKTLEEIGKTLFKHWFIDFEFPNEQGKPYKSSGGKMIWNEELEKEIPEGWVVDSLVHNCPTISSGRKAELIPKGKYAIYGSNGVIGRTNNFIINWPFIITGRVGSIGNIDLILEDAWISDNAIFIKPDKGYLVYYLYYLLRSFSLGFLNRGSTQPLITKSDLCLLNILVPNDDVLLIFYNSIEKSFEKIKNNTYEIETLRKTRDTLLPKLMSGEIRVV